jgi:phosphatidylglycerol:prolipoprotein diacylglycerol transferase
MYPVLIDLGWWQLRSYGLFVAIALGVGVWWNAREGERRGFPRALVYEFAQLVALAGLVGARLYYAIVSEPEAYLARPWEILAVWHGGLSVHGGLLGGLAAAVWVIRRRRLPFWPMADAVVPGLILGQAVGQIACLLNGDTFGRPTTVPWAIVFTDRQAMAPLGVPLHPIQVYELLAYLLVFVAVQKVARSAARPGTAVLTCAVLYGAARFGLEFFRGDPPVIAGVVVPQAVSALLVAAGAVGLWRLRLVRWRSHGTVAG